MSETGAIVTVVASVISGAAGIGGSLVQRWAFKRDEEQKDKVRKVEKAVEDVLMSDAAIVSEIKPMLDQLRKEIDYIRSPIRDGIATSMIWTPEARFYKTATRFYYATLTGYIHDENLRTATQRIVDTIDQFIHDTHNVGITRHYGEQTNRTEFIKEVTEYEERRKQWIEDFVKQHEEFLKLVAETVGYHRLREPLWARLDPKDATAKATDEG